MPDTRNLRARRRRTWGALALAACLLLGASHAFAGDSRYEHDRRNDSYVFATTRGVNEMDINPALKLTILPVALLVDFVFFPFALIADSVS